MAALGVKVVMEIKGEPGMGLKNLQSRSRMKNLML